MSKIDNQIITKEMFEKLYHFRTCDVKCNGIECSMCPFFELAHHVSHAKRFMSFFSKSDFDDKEMNEGYIIKIENFNPTSGEKKKEES